MNSVVETESGSLAERARRLGVADRYHGFWGKEEIVPHAVLQRALHAMAGDGHGAATQHLGLPFVHVARQGERTELRWTSHEDTPARWRLAHEDDDRELASG